MNGSYKFTINGYDVWATIRGGLIIFASIVLTAIVSFVGEHYLSWQYVVALGDFTIDLRVIAVPVISSALDLGRRYLTDLSNWRQRSF